MDDAVQLHDFASLFSLTGKTAVVTGGSQGIGLYAASGLLQAGASLVFICARNAERCQAACQALNALPGLAPGARAVPVPADVSSSEGVGRLAAQVRQHTDRVDILFANAGTGSSENIDTVSDSEISAVMDLNIGGTIKTVSAMVPLLETAAAQNAHREPSRVIVTSSIFGLVVPRVDQSTAILYSTSKAALIHLSRNLAIALGPRNITVNSISPGVFPTALTMPMINMVGGVEKMVDKSPNHRIGRPEDIAGVVIYLASRAGSHVNAVNIVIDGGDIWNRYHLHA